MACVSADASGLMSRPARRDCDVAGASTLAAGLSTSSIFSASLTSFCSEVMTLPPVKPVAASLTSSKLFLRSAISASRMASWNWPWNSAAILRALPIHCPTMRSTPGNSFGPMAISATTAMIANSLHGDVEHEKFRSREAISAQYPSTRSGPPASFLNRLAARLSQDQRAARGLPKHLRRDVQTALLPTSDRAAAEGAVL